MSGNWRLEKKAGERYQNLSEEKKEKGDNMVKNVSKISGDEKQIHAEYRKKYYRMIKMPSYDYKKAIILKNNDLESSFGEV